MSDNCGDFRFVRRIVGIEFQGTTIPLEPLMAQTLATMVERGYIYADEIYVRKAHSKTAHVTISKLRSVLSDLGLPYAIKCPELGRRGHTRARYVLIPLD